MFATSTAIALGLVVGARHAFEPDHLAAVSTLVGSSRSPKNAIGLGLLWGLGHTLSLLVVGIALILLGGVMPAMWIGLRNRDGHAGPHRHGGVEHVHGGAGDHVHVHGRAIAWRPLTIGLVHGLAGSGALTALAFAELPTTGARVLYMLMFGTGSIAGMAVATGITGVALQQLAHGPGTRRAFSLGTGALSCAVGVAWALALL
jgi:hypothetical protein